MQIKINPHNKLVYMDMLKDLVSKRNGPVTISLVVNTRLVVEYTLVEAKRGKRTA